MTLSPGKGHDFHKHPDQEEVIYVVAGEVEQWVDREKRMLGPGDCAFIPADVVHASFNVGTSGRQDRGDPRPLRREIGYELVDVAGDAPWKELRTGRVETASAGWYLSLVDIEEKRDGLCVKRRPQAQSGPQYRPRQATSEGSSS